MSEKVFSFDIGWAFHGWGIREDNNILDTGVYAFEHDKSFEEYAKIRRDKNRKKSKKNRLERLKKMFVEENIFQDIRSVETFLKESSHQNQLWENLKKAHTKNITEKEFVQILYRFAGRRHYVDMRKKESSKKQKTDKAQSEMKKSWDEMEEIYHSLEDQTWFNALFERRESIIQTLKKSGIAIDDSKFPYTNAKLEKFLNKDEIKKVEKALNPYSLMLKTEQIVESIEEIAKRQREKETGNSVIFTEAFMEKYRKLVTFKGVHPSLEDKIGQCLSGLDMKRHPISSIDAERTRIAQSYHKIICETDQNDNIVHELSVAELGISFDDFTQIVLELCSANQKAEITAKKILDKIKKKDTLLKKKSFVYKDFMHKDDPSKSIVLRLPGHRRLKLLSSEASEGLLEDDKFRDAVEFEMLCYRDPDRLKKSLKNIFDNHKKMYTDDDLEILSISDVGKPAPCSNMAYRSIMPLLKNGKDFQTALGEKYPESTIRTKRHYRRMLDYKIYLKAQKQKGINNPFQDTVVKEFIFLFNRLIQKYGEADRIVLETTRAILSEKEKDDFIKKQRQNEKLNQQINEVLDKYSKDEKKPAKGARERLKLYVKQGGDLADSSKSAKCLLTGNPISLSAAIEGDRTNTDHIIPQTWVHDNRLVNKILLDASVNQRAKQDMTPLQYLVSIGYDMDRAKEKLKAHIKGTKLSKLKVRYLFEKRNKEKIKKDTEDRIHSMDQRMKGVQDASIKVIMGLLVDQYRFNSTEELSISQYRSKVLPVTGKMTSIFRRGWLKEYKKDRSKYHNHAVDALVMLNFDRAFLNQYISLLKKSYLEDKNPIWIAKEKMRPVIAEFESKVCDLVKEFDEQSRVVVRRPLMKYRGRLYEQTAIKHKEAIEKGAVLAKNHFFKLAAGFLKLELYRNNKGKLLAYKIHPGNPIKLQGHEYAAHSQLYRHSLMKVKSKSFCGYYYLIGYSNRGEIEMIPANCSSIKRLRPTLSSFAEFDVIRKLPINGKVKNPHCQKE